MKRLSRVFILLLAVFVMTGCVKQTVHMDITDDGKVTMTGISAMASGGDAGEQDILDAEDKASMEKLGYKVEDYTENDMVGIKFTKTYKLKDVSSEEAKEVHIELAGQEEFDDSVLFQTVKKGLLSSTYKANFVFDTSADVDPSMSEYADQFEIAYSVTLPRAPKSNNADKVEGNTLTWNVKYGEKKAINYEFEIKNNTAVYVGIGALVLIAIAGIITVVSKKKKPNNPSDNTVVGQMPVSNTPVVPQEPVSNPAPVAPETEVVPPTNQQ